MGPGRFRFSGINEVSESYRARRAAVIPKEQKFPKLWQVLVLALGGFLIFFSSCAGALSGMGGGAPPFQQWLVGAGLLAGAIMFVTGLVLGLVWLILTVARAFSAPEPGFGASTRPESRTESIAQEERQTVWRLRVAIVCVIVFAGGGSSLLLSSRFSHGDASFGGLLFISLLLGNVPYIFSLVRLVRGADRVGISVALATASLQLVFWSWELFTRLHAFALLTLFSPTPVAEILTVAFAFQLGRTQPPEENDKQILAVAFGGVGAYLLLLHLILPYLRAAIFR
jgi:hypothetical protein